jgi:hypothetical protein
VTIWASQISRKISTVPSNPNPINLWIDRKDGYFNSYLETCTLVSRDYGWPLFALTEGLAFNKWRSDLKHQFVSLEKWWYCFTIVHLVGPFIPANFYVPARDNFVLSLGNHIACCYAFINTTQATVIVSDTFVRWLIPVHTFRRSPPVQPKEY